MDIEIRPEEVFGLTSAVAIIPIIVAHIKPALRRVWPDAGPWELIADVIGVLWVLGIWQAGFAPEWIVNPWAAVLAGVAVGVASSRVRDAVQAVTSARSFVDDGPWENIAPEAVPRGLVGSLDREFDASKLPADIAAPAESRSAIKAY